MISPLQEQRQTVRARWDGKLKKRMTKNTCNRRREEPFVEKPGERTRGENMEPSRTRLHVNETQILKIIMYFKISLQVYYK